MAATRPRVAYTCSYTPLPLLDAAGFTPWRLLPITSAEERAGALLHDNVCPLVKRMLDRALAVELPELAAIVIMSSCETMRRFADAWPVARPSVPAILVDLPPAPTATGLEYFESELRRLGRELEAVGGCPLEPGSLAQSIGRYDALAAALAERARAGARHRAGAADLQALRLRSVSLPVEEALAEAVAPIDRSANGRSFVRWPARLASADGSAADGRSVQTRAARAVEPSTSARSPGAVPVMLTGNMLPDPEAFALLEQCGLEVLADDLCTGSRQLTLYAPRAGEDPLHAIARATLERPPCARTIDFGKPGDLADRVAAQAKAAGARGVVAHVLKFCDPYLGRLPTVREALRRIGLPLLVLEGDCTLRSLGQYRTRLEAFAETLRDPSLNSGAK